jgi:Ni/Fe-hydrogenase subunit HybB-like protein
MKMLGMRITFWRVALGAILAGGLYSAVVRYSRGLGASTALSDDFPWGLWIGFDVLSGVALAAGGFTISAVVYLFNIERFKPIIRPTILTAFLGYLLVSLALLFDLGRPYRIWHPLVMWNPHSIMFEVAWCVILYTTVLALEFSPLLLERLRMNRTLKVVHSLTIPLVILGVILSTLHQSSLGSLYLIVPTKLHPLWYSSLLPVFFFISAVGLGCAMTIIESFLSFRAFRKRLEIDLLADLGKVIVVVMAVYLVLKAQDLSGKGALGLAFAPTYEGRMFLAEILLGAVAPIVLLAFPKIRRNHFGLFVAALMVVLGVVMNRLNVSITGMEAFSGPYFPSWTEISVTLFIVAFGFLLFGLAVRYLPIFPAEEAGESAPGELRGLPAAEVLREPFRGSTGVVSVLGGIFFLSAVGLAFDGIRYRDAARPPAPVESREPDLRRGLASLKLPADIRVPRSSSSPGPVVFRHASHVDLNRPNCAACHGGLFPILKPQEAAASAARSLSEELAHLPKPVQPARLSARAAEAHSEKACGACHDGKRAFNAMAACMLCHRTE